MTAESLPDPDLDGAPQRPRFAALRPARGTGLGQMFGGRLAVVVMGLGLLTIGIGWFGASGSGALIDGRTDLRAQLPYLLSGGFLGLSLVVIGAALLVSQSARLERARQEALIEARFDALASALGPAGAPLLRAVPDGAVVAGNAAFHDPACHLVDGRPGQELVTVDVAEDRGLRPCRLCRS